MSEVITFKRWSPQRKAVLLKAIDSGEMTAADAQALNGISDEEMLEWRRGYKAGGTRGLRITRRPGRSPLRTPAGLRRSRRRRL